MGQRDPGRPKKSDQIHTEGIERQLPYVKPQLIRSDDRDNGMYYKI